MQAERAQWTQRVRHALLTWYQADNRDIPWRRDANPYYVWLGEIMAQQTRIAAVIPYFERFIATFPDVHALAQADEAEVLKAWEGLGYYSRARNLHRAAAALSQDGCPSSAKGWLELPGVGPYTAAAVASIALGERIAAVDGNALRVISRLFGLWEDIAGARSKAQVGQILHCLLPEKQPGDGNQAVMELGATLCLPKQPRCASCPLPSLCSAAQNGWTATLPIKQNKKMPTPIRRAVALVQNSEGAFLLRQRSERLLHGLWEFPGWDTEEKVTESECQYVCDQLLTLGIQTKNLQPTWRFAHTFTHRIWQMQGYAGEVASCAVLPEGYAWHTAQDWDSLPMPTAMAAFKAKLQEQDA